LEEAEQLAEIDSKVMQSRLQESEILAEKYHVYKRQHNLLMQANEELGVERLVAQNRELRRATASMRREIKLKDWQMRSVVRGVFTEVALNSAPLVMVLPDNLAGLLKKKGQGRFDGFAKRWFVLDRNVLTWYKEEPKVGVEARGCLDMTSVTDIQCNRGMLAICVVTNDIVYELEAFDTEGFNRWSQGLIRFVNPFED